MLSLHALRMRGLGHAPFCGRLLTLLSLRSLLFSNLVLGGTLALAAIGWFVAFIGQIVAQANNVTRVPGWSPSDRLGVLWFGIFVSLFLILGVAVTLGTDSIASSRLQISAWTVVALVFAVIGIDKGIYADGNAKSLQAVAAGYFLLTIVFVIWLFFFTAEEDSAIYAMLSSFGSGGLSGPGARTGGVGGRQMRMAGNASSGGIGGGSTFATGFQGGNSSGGAYTQAYGQSPSAVDVTAGGPPKSQTAHSIRSAAAPASRAAAGSEYARSQAEIAPGSPTSTKPAGTVEGEPTPGYGYRARALYACE